jgi:hypothetical protein
MNATTFRTPIIPESRNAAISTRCTPRADAPTSNAEPLALDPAGVIHGIEAVARPAA